MEAYQQRHRRLGDAALAEGRGWVKLWFDPWYRLVRREPPTWLRRRMLAALLDIHRAWHERLAEHERETGEPFDCQLWLFDPHFMGSQVVFSVGEWRAGYRDTFPPPRGDAPPRPPAIYDDPAYRLGALDWTPGTEAGYVWQEDLDDDPEWAAWFERGPRSRVIDTVDAHDGPASGTCGWGGFRAAHRPDSASGPDVERDRAQG
ncbi:MAG: hypothetical protein AAF845_08360 [Bacteroidota bacterium]